jgi:hypothetical protein
MCVYRLCGYGKQSQESCVIHHQLNIFATLSWLSHGDDGVVGYFRLSNNYKELIYNKLLVQYDLLSSLPYSRYGG